MYTVDMIDHMTIIERCKQTVRIMSCTIINGIYIFAFDQSKSLYFWIEIVEVHYILQ